MNIVIIGLGGTGSYLSRFIGRYLNTIDFEGDIIYIDGDSYDEKNMNRQEFAPVHVGMNKAQSAKIVSEAIFPNIFIKHVEDYLGNDNVSEYIKDGDYVFLCVDNHVCRKIVSQHCESLNNIKLFSPGNEKIDGNVHTYIKKDGQELTEKLGVRHPEVLSTNDGDRAEMSCEELSNIEGGEQLIVANVMSASITFNCFHNIFKDDKYSVDVYFDCGKNKVVPR